MHITDMTKKIFLAFVTMLTLTLSASAQIKMGVKAGLNITNMEFSKEVVSKSNQEGFFAGITLKADLPISPVSVDAAVLYDQRSAKATVTHNDGMLQADYGEKNFKQESIIIPVNLRLKFPLGSLLGVFVAAGPQIDVNMSKDREGQGEDGFNFKWDKTNFSVNAGGGITVLDKIEIGANYNFAIDDSGKSSSIRNFSTKSHATQIYLSYYF